MGFLPPELMVRVQEVVDCYFTKMYSHLSHKENLDEIANILVIGQAREILTNVEVWDDIIYACMERLRSNTYCGKFANFSLSCGHAYVSSVIHFYSENTGYYRKFLEKYDSTVYAYLTGVVENLLQRRKPLQTQDYDMISGMAGVVQNLIEWPNDISLAIAHRISEYLTSLTDYVPYKGGKVPGWYVSGDDYLTRLRMESYPDGHINFGMAHGITGVLASLIKLGENGINKNKVDQAINVIIDELDKVRCVSPQGEVYYPGMLNVNDYANGEYWKDQNYRMSWCYGTISVLYTLYRGYEYLNKPEKCIEVLKEIEQIAKRGNQSWMLTSPIICHGYAGTAMIFKKIYDKTQNNTVKKAALDLVQCTVDSYIDSSLYGFKDVYYRMNGTQVEKIEEDKNTFLEGGSGIISALLSFMVEKELTSTLMLLT